MVAVAVSFVRGSETATPRPRRGARAGWVARLGLWLGLAVAAAPATGCSSCDKLFCCPGGLYGPPNSDNSVSQVVATWQSEVQYTTDTLHNGATMAGLAGKIYLFSPHADQPLVGGGELEVEVFDESRPGVPPMRLEKYQFDKKTLRELMRPDPIGNSYTVFLPLPHYRPDITQVKFKVCYKTERGNPLYTVSNTTALKHGDLANFAMAPGLAKAPGPNGQPQPPQTAQQYPQQQFQSAAYNQQQQNPPAGYYQQQQQQYPQQQFQQQYPQAPPANVQRFVVPPAGPGVPPGQYPPPYQQQYPQATTGVPTAPPTFQPPVQPFARKPEPIQTSPPDDLPPHLRSAPGTAPQYTPPATRLPQPMYSGVTAVPPVPPAVSGSTLPAEPTWSRRGGGQLITTGQPEVPVVPPPNTLNPQIPRAEAPRGEAPRVGLDLGPAAPASPGDQGNVLPPIPQQSYAAEAGESSGLRVFYDSHKR